MHFGGFFVVENAYGNFNSAIINSVGAGWVVVVVAIHHLNLPFALKWAFILLRLLDTKVMPGEIILFIKVHFTNSNNN